MKMYRSSQWIYGKYRQPGGDDDKRVIVPSSHLGSRRFMTTKTQDALSIVAKRGRPLFFITITTNKEWKEIRSRIPAGASTFDYPEVIACVTARCACALSSLTQKRIHLRACRSWLAYFISNSKRSKLGSSLVLCGVRRRLMWTPARGDTASMRPTARDF